MEPGYGETPISDEDAEALLPNIRELLGEPITKAAVFDLEQGIQEQVIERLLPAAFEGRLALDDLLSDYFLRDLHGQLYGEIWIWAGKFRVREVNIGITPAQIAVELRSSLDSIRYRWEHTDDWTPRQLGIVTHAETVRIHPFTDGNGRTTRMLADLVFAATQEGEVLRQYDWDLDKPRYIALLRDYDVSRDPRALADFVELQSIDE